MATSYSPKIVTSDLCFAWDGMNSKCWDGSSTTHYDLISRSAGTKSGAGALTRTNNHVYFTGAGNRICTITFPSSNITVPTGDQGTWMWTSYFVDSGNWDHPNIGKETGSSWDGVNGFVFGTGWSTDGPRWGVAGTTHNVYSNESISNADYRNNVWQIYAVTYTRNSATGLKTYLFDSNGMRLCDQRTTSNVAIGSNTNALYIGATNSRGGNWQGYMDNVYMWTRALSQEEIFQSMDAISKRFGL